MIEKKDLKVCMFLQRKAALWGHALALELKELGVAQFSAYASPFRSAEFLRAQHDIAYQPLLVDEEIIANFKDEKIDFTFLKDMEEKYGMPNLWHYIFMDRYLIMSKAKTSYEPSYNYHEMLQILQLRLRAIVKMLEETKPDVMIFSSIATMPSLLCYQISKKMGIKTMQVASTRVGKRIGVMEGLEEYTSVLSVFKSIQAGQRERKYEAEALGFLKEFRQEKKAAYTVFQLSHSKFLPKRVYKALVHIIRRTFRHSTTTRKNDYMEEDNVNYFRKRISKKINTWRGYDKLFKKPDFSKNYVFFPLHVEPEAATLTLAIYNINQINLIRNIALSLPIDYKLYVKEHPCMINTRKRSYYKKILRVPNVELIDCKTPSVDLIKNAKLITTITGTVGWEATLLGKPVITFGNAFYNIFSFVKRCENIEKLPSLIKDSLHHFNYNEKELVDYLSALFEESVDIDLYKIWITGTSWKLIKEEGMFKELARFIYDRI